MKKRLKRVAFVVVVFIFAGFDWQLFLYGIHLSGFESPLGQKSTEDPNILLAIVGTILVIFTVVVPVLFAALVVQNFKGSIWSRK